MRNDPPAKERQYSYLDALTAHSPLVRIVDGRFQEKHQYCRSCDSTWVTYEEKETDVSIAVSLVEDAALDRFDTALLISADSDLCPAIRSLKRVAPDKRVVAAFPPKRHSAGPQRHVDAWVRIGADKLRQSQLPETVAVDGVVLKRPSYWQ